MTQLARQAGSDFPRVSTLSSCNREMQTAVPVAEMLVLRIRLSWATPGNKARRLASLTAGARFGLALLETVSNGIS